MSGVHHQNTPVKLGGGGGGGGPEDKVILTFQEDTRAQDHFSWNDDGTKKHEVHSFYRTPDIGKPRIYVSEAERTASQQKAKSGGAAHVEISTHGVTVNHGHEPAVHVPHDHDVGHHEHPHLEHPHDAHHDHAHDAHAHHDHAHDSHSPAAHHEPAHVVHEVHHSPSVSHHSPSPSRHHSPGYTTTTVTHHAKRATDDDNCKKCAAERAAGRSGGHHKSVGVHHHHVTTHHDDANMHDLMTHKYGRESQARRSQEQAARKRQEASYRSSRGLIKDTKANILRTGWNSATKWVDHPEMEETRWNKHSPRSGPTQWDDSKDIYDPKKALFKPKLFKPEDYYNPHEEHYLRLDGGTSRRSSRTPSPSRQSPYRGYNY